MDGLVRVANDPYDDLFGQVIRHDSPAIWDRERQSFIHKSVPVPVHSHNDYQRRIPLFEALGSGCVSVEADIHLQNSDLLVGHTSHGLRSGSSLRSMYLEPLQRMLEQQNANVTSGSWRGIFDAAPQQTLVLLVDHKSSGAETFAELYTQLHPLRDLDYLTYWNGTDTVIRPITVVATGNAPFESVVGLDASHRDIFWDAKLESLHSINDNFDVEPYQYQYNRSNSYYASTEFKNAVLYSYLNNTHILPPGPRSNDMAISQIQQAKARGLISRYWATPSSPPNLREIVWRVLIEVEVGILNMDDMGIVRARARQWGSL